MQEQHRQLGSALLELTAIGASERLGWEVFLLGLRLMDYINQDKQIVLRRGALPDNIPHLLIDIHSRTVYTLLPLTPSSDLTRKHCPLSTNGRTRRLLICSRRLRFTLSLLLAESRQEDMDGIRLDLDEFRNPALHSNDDLGGAHFQGSECPDDIRAVNAR
jgi:hypothetical protein